MFKKTAYQSLILSRDIFVITILPDEMRRFHWFTDPCKSPTRSYILWEFPVNNLMGDGLLNTKKNPIKTWSIKKLLHQVLLTEYMWETNLVDVSKRIIYSQMDSLRLFISLEYRRMVRILQSSCNLKQFWMLAVDLLYWGKVKQHVFRLLTFENESSTFFKLWMQWWNKYWKFSLTL